MWGGVAPLTGLRLLDWAVFIHGGVAATLCSMQVRPNAQLYERGAPKFKLINCQELASAAALTQSI